MNVFYTSGTEWFDNMANGLCWLLIAAVAAFFIWLGYDLITGPRKQRSEVKRMLEGLDTSYYTEPVSHKLKTKTTATSAAVTTTLETAAVPVSGSPFAPGKPRRKRADQPV